ncbi:MAG: endonuclease III [Alphaproteobacteria bacterium]|nr:endonuclease III [Alphaproteobacteria bacterium]
MAAKAEKKSPKLKQHDINAVFDILSGIMPEPKTELNFVNPYTLLVAVALSAQATDVSVNNATKALFEKVQTPEGVLALGVDQLKDHIKTIGLFNTKAKNVIAMAEQLIRDHGSEVPRDRDALEKLPGVGRKTANVVLNEAFGIPTIAVDTHIFRVGNRTGMAVGSTPLKVEQLLEMRVPDAFKKQAHHWLILHGRYTCLARKPRCGICPISSHCNFREKTEA